MPRSTNTLAHFLRVANISKKRSPKDLNKKTVAQLKRKLWEVFSLYIRQRDTDQDGYGHCISCQKPIQLGTQDCQAGHYIPKGKGGSHHFGLPRFPDDVLAERNCNAQCGSPCNISEGGNFINYEIGLREKYGDAETDELKKAGAVNPVFKRTKPDLIEIIEYYKNLI